MRLLMTAGNTQTPLDRVRCITNVFSGRTGTGIAGAALRAGHDVCLLTSHPDRAAELVRAAGRGRIELRAFETFDDLAGLMASLIPGGAFDAIVHCAAVSDFRVAGVYAPHTAARFDAEAAAFVGAADGPHLADCRRGKVRSTHEELWLRLTPTPKLVDRIRGPWGFGGVLVKFKLEVGVSEAELRSIADRSRRQSGADLLVANTFEGRHDCAYFTADDRDFVRVGRDELAERVVGEVMRLDARRRVPPARSLRAAVGEAVAAQHSAA